jgi:hypothetical protein
MSQLLEHLVLDRIDLAEATVGMVSLPLPRDHSELSINHSTTCMQPVAWWTRHEKARRAIAYVVDEKGVPPQLRVVDSKSSSKPASESKWKLETRITLERLDFVPHKFQNIDALRGVPAKDCTTVESDLHLTFGDRSIALQFGCTGPKGGPYYWQNVQIDRLWHNAAAEAVRVGGVMYNEDTYLWADVYFVLFANGVAQVAAHFVNTKLHIKGYDFQGLPVIRFAGDALKTIDAQFPKDGMMFDAGAFKLNLADSAHMASEKEPGTLKGDGKELFWKPVSRTFNPQLPDAPPMEWPVGFARTFRFQFSLSDAAPVIARYRVPDWWYSICGEPWQDPYLPVQGEYARLGETTSEYIRSLMTRGKFDAPSADLGNDGDSGGGILKNYYHTGCPDCFTDALNYCYYWADIAVDHTDFTVHQWFGGWGWKTCAYTRFRDVLYGYLETGDPYLLDTAEMVSEAYWAWFRSNWPRCTIGRDAYEFAGWAMLWRTQQTEHARERTRELARMLYQVLDTRGSVGGQIGAGPHPGYHSSLYMTGVCLISLLDIAEAELEAGNQSALAAMLPYFIKMEDRFSRTDIELFPSEYGMGAKGISPTGHATKAAMMMRIYPQLARLYPGEIERCRRGLAAIPGQIPPTLEEYGHSGRVTNNLVPPLYHDALLLGAIWKDGHLEISPMLDAATFPSRQIVSTPLGSLTMHRSNNELKFESETKFPITIRHGGKKTTTDSTSTCTL